MIRPAALAFGLLATPAWAHDIAEEHTHGLPLGPLALIAALLGAGALVLALYARRKHGND